MVDPDGRNPTFVRLAELAANVASRYGTAAYNWATRFFNSPVGQEVTQIAAEALTGSQLPLGFSNATQFRQFGETVGSGLAEIAGQGTRAFLTGSAVSGSSFRSRAAFDMGRTSDFDVAIVADTLLNKAKDLGIELRSRGTRTGPLGQGDLKALGLDKLAQRLSGMAGRPVNFLIYQSVEALRARGNAVVPFF